MKPQDILVALKLLHSDPAQTYEELGKSLAMSPSESHAAIRRLIESRLVEPDSRRVIRQSLLRFLIHGVPFAFPAILRETTRGVPTAWGAPCLRGHIVSNDPPPVWPHPEGAVRGQALKPLYPSAVAAAAIDARLYDLLALVDAVRIGRARERKIAEEELTQRIKEDAR